MLRLAFHNVRNRRFRSIFSIVHLGNYFDHDIEKIVSYVKNLDESRDGILKSLLFTILAEKNHEVALTLSLRNFR